MDPLNLSPGLLVYGPLGAAVIALAWSTLKLYKDRERERAEHAREVADLHARVTGKAETWMEKYHDLSKSLNDLLESIERRYTRDHTRDRRG